MKKHFIPVIVIFIITASLSQAQNPILWGKPSFGGANNKGTIFSYNSSTDRDTDLHNFGSDTDGQIPYGSLIMANNGLLYGMTVLGGINPGGTIFSYNISTDTETVLHDFGSGIDGQTPYGSLIQGNDSLLYGLTAFGGVNMGVNGAYGDGILFSYNISTGAETVLHYFGSDTDGQNPYGTLLQVNDSLLYGTTGFGGVNDEGTIFSYNISTGTEYVLHSFGSGNDGLRPLGALIKADNGLLYGLAALGGTYDSGMIFSYNISTGAETDLHDFAGGDTDGRYAYSSLIQASNGLLYGMTCYGGAGDSGLIFSYNISTGKETDIHNFTGADGAFPFGDLIEIDTIPVTPLEFTICEGNRVTLTANGATTYTWMPSTGLNATTGDKIVATPLVTTTYTVTGTNTNDWTLTAIYIVKVTPLNSLIIQPQSPSICLGDSITLSVPVSGSGYLWSPMSALNVSTGDTVIAVISDTTAFRVLGTDSMGCAVQGSDTAFILHGPTKPVITQNGNLLTSSATQGNQWYRNDSVSMIPGADHETYTLTSIGCYWVIATNPANGCSSTSDTICITTLESGINQLSVTSYQLSVYPNPNNGLFTIKLNNNQNGYTVEIYNVIGEKIYESVLSNSQNTINLSSQPAGMYFVYLKSDEVVEVGKVVVSK